MRVYLRAGAMVESILCLALFSAAVCLLLLLETYDQDDHEEDVCESVPAENSAGPSRLVA